MASQRELSVLILGATGVTGKQAVPYMRDRAVADGRRWGIGGRDRAKLEALVSDWPETERPEIVVADASDHETLAAAVSRAETVVNFAGPFARLAPPVIEACVEAGTDYVDVTGEINFVAEVIERWHSRAAADGVRIVQVCGFESLPFDLLVAAVIERMRAAHGSVPAAVDVLFEGSPPPKPRPSDLVSRGTFESLREALASDHVDTLGDPAALVGELADPGAVRKVSPLRMRPWRHPDAGVLGPMMPSPIINPPVLQRSFALAGLPPIRYREGVAATGLVPGKALAAVAAAASSAVNATTGALARAPAGVRRAAARALGAVSPSGGPREDRLEGWRWTLRALAVGPAGERAEGSVAGAGHPGYLATSRFTAEAGLILSDPAARVPEAAGCLTPAAALGTGELARFTHAGLRFELE